MPALPADGHLWSAPGRMAEEIGMSRLLLLLAVMVTIQVATVSAGAAEFVSLQSARHGSWSTHLFRNNAGGRLFCAIESRDGSTYFRINRYKSSTQVGD
jgi:hypothetical protein